MPVNSQTVRAGISTPFVLTTRRPATPYISLRLWRLPIVKPQTGPDRSLNYSRRYLKPYRVSQPRSFRTDRPKPQRSASISVTFKQSFAENSRRDRLSEDPGHSGWPLDRGAATIGSARSVLRSSEPLGGPETDPTARSAPRHSHSTADRRLGPPSEGVGGPTPAGTASGYPGRVLTRARHCSALP